MSAKSFAFSLLSGLVIKSCDPGYMYMIKAPESSELHVTISPSVESISCPELSDMCSFAKAHRVDSSSNGSLYILRPGEQMVIFGGVGFSASIDRFPFTRMHIRKLDDTTSLIGKTEILSRFKSDKKGGRNYFLGY